jgi:hypothetical protein
MNCWKEATNRVTSESSASLTRAMQAIASVQVIPIAAASSTGRTERIASPVQMKDDQPSSATTLPTTAR